MGRAIAYYTRIGAVVSLPLNDCQDYDIVVDIDGILKKVQVKTTRYKVRDTYKVSLKSQGGSTRKIYGNVNSGSCDLLFVAVEDGRDYSIPNVDLPSSCLSLGDEVAQYRV